jgi:hypothetical protein
MLLFALAMNLATYSVAAAVAPEVANLTSREDCSSDGDVEVEAYSILSTEVQIYFPQLMGKKQAGQQQPTLLTTHRPYMALCLLKRTQLTAYAYQLTQAVRCSQKLGVMH